VTYIELFARLTRSRAEHLPRRDDELEQSFGVPYVYQAVMVNVADHKLSGVGHLLAKDDIAIGQDRHGI
jgi:hypothetical protein